MGASLAPALLAFAALLAVAYGFAAALAWGARRAARTAVPALRDAAVHLAAAWDRSAAVRRWPHLAGWVRGRLSPAALTGLPLTLLLLLAAGGARLVFELAEAVREAEDVIRLDAAIDAAVLPHRTEPLVSLFVAITHLGGVPASIAVGALASLALWRGRRACLLPLWVTILGSQLATQAGKYLVARPRPELMVGVLEHSPAFPSGHATAALATYGFVAYLLARPLGTRGRFELLFWSSVLVALIGFSRIFLNVHHASDVLAGYLVGALWLLVGIAWLEWRLEASRRA